MTKISNLPNLTELNDDILVPVVDESEINPKNKNKKLNVKLLKGLDGKSFLDLVKEHYDDIEDISDVIKLIAEESKPKDTVTKFKTDTKGFLFDPIYWMVNGPRSSSFSLITDSDKKELEVSCIFRTSSDMVSLIWEAEDYLKHQYLKRESIFDYTNMQVSFTLSVEGDVPDLDDDVGLTLTIEHLDEDKDPDYVRVWNYRNPDNATPKTIDITLDFNNLYSGFYGENLVDVSAVSKMFFTLTSLGYDKDSYSIFESNQKGVLKIFNISSQDSFKVNSIETNPHDVGICTSFDDDGVYSPERIVQNIYSLGYVGKVNHYCGMSHYYEFKYDSEENRFKVITDYDPNQPFSVNNSVLNETTIKWHKSFLENLVKRNMSAIFSISYELFSEVCPYEWAQRDWDDNFGVTGYEPPSFLLSPCIVPAMDWLKKVFMDFASIMDETGCPIWMQIGEPWWWFNPTTGNPCIYDYPTRLKFNDETGLYAPKFESINDFHENEEVYQKYLEFLQKELGQSVIDIKDHVKEYFPKAQLSPLIFLPSILDESVGIMSTINYPKKLWTYPEFDFIQTEGYDWLIVDDLVKSIECFTRAINELDYPAHLIHYLAGFVPDNNLGELIDPDYDLEIDGVRIWKNVMGSVYQARKFGVGRTYIWAYPQVIRDSLFFSSEGPQDEFKILNSTYKINNNFNK